VEEQEVKSFDEGNPKRRLIKGNLKEQQSHEK
jgi:hypothetical protein